MFNKAKQTAWDSNEEEFFELSADGKTLKLKKDKNGNNVASDYDIIDGKLTRVKNIPTTPNFNRGGLDNVVKSLPASDSTTPLQNDLEALARGNLSLKDGLFGGLSKTGNIIDGSKVLPTNLGGSGKSGSLSGVGGSSQKASTDLVKLANPVFTAGASEKGATVDIYGQTLNSPQNAIKSILSDVLGIAGKGLSGLLQDSLAANARAMNILDKITDEKTAGNILDKFKTSILSGVPLTNDSVKKIFYESIGYDGKSLNFKDGINGVGKGILKDIVDNVDGVKGIMTLYNGVEFLTKTDMDTTTAVFKVIDNFTKDAGNGILLDLATKMKIMKTVTQSVMNLGLPEVFQKIYDKMTDKDKDRYVRDNLPGGLESGDLDFLKLALDHNGSGWVLSVYPNAVNLLVSSYTPTVGVDGRVDKSEYAKFVDILNRLDPNWYKASSRNGVAVGNLNVFSNFNKDAKLAFLAGGDRGMIRNMLLSEKFGGVYNTLNELQKRHPYYPIKA